MYFYVKILHHNLKNKTKKQTPKISHHLFMVNHYSSFINEEKIMNFLIFFFKSLKASFVFSFLEHSISQQTQLKQRAVSERYFCSCSSLGKCVNLQVALGETSFSFFFFKLRKSVAFERWLFGIFCSLILFLPLL